MRFPILLVFCFCACAAAAQSLPQLLTTELQRNFDALKQKGDPPPYFMAYEVADEESQVITTGLGSLLGNSKTHGRFLDITVRVGSPKMDNYHIVRGQRPRFTPGVMIPLDDVPNAIRRALWLSTDRTYRAAARRLIEIRSNAQTRLAGSDQSDDFSAETPVDPPGVAAPREILRR